MILATPAQLFAVHAGDVDQDGTPELILEERLESGAEPDRVRLTLVWFDQAAQETQRQTLSLGNRATYWQAEHGLWLLHGAGVDRWDTAAQSRVRVVDQDNALSGLGPTTPSKGTFVADLDGDDQAELIIPRAGGYDVLTEDGSNLGRIDARHHGSLDAADSRGGTGLRWSAASAPMVVADMDADGLKDVLLPANQHLDVAYTAKGTAGARRTRFDLPFALDQDDSPRQRGETRRRIDDVRFGDVTGDNLADLLAVRWVSEGSWFGSTAELMLVAGTRQGFPLVQIVPTEQAVVHTEWVDIDDDGDQDIIAMMIDVGLGTMARALFSRKLKIEVAAFFVDDGKLAPEPTTLRHVAYPLGSEDEVHGRIQTDVDGDGLPDLVTNDGEQVIRVYAGRGTSIDDQASHQAAVEVPLGEDPVFVHDLTGDGVGEIVVWGRERTTATVLRVPPSG